VETQSRLHFGCGYGSGRCLPTLVGIRPLRHQLRPSSSLDYLESTTIQHSSPWSSSRLMELCYFQHLGLGSSACSYSSGSCRQYHPSQTVSLRRTGSVRSCPSRLRCRDKLRYNELLSFPFLYFYIFLVAVLILVAGLLFNSRLSGNLVTTGAMRTHLSTGNVAASCPKCGSNLQSQTKFCPNCGEAQSRT